MQTPRMFLMLCLLAGAVALPQLRGQVFPIAHCMEIKPGTPYGSSMNVLFIAHFGYMNLDGVTRFKPKGADSTNYFTPAPNTFPSQPNYFYSGLHPYTMTAFANMDSPNGYLGTADITWNLGLGSATVHMPFIPNSDTNANRSQVPFCELEPAPRELVFTHPGTYPNRTLATINGAMNYQNVTVVPSKLGGDPNVILTNFTYYPATFSGTTVANWQYSPGVVTADVTIKSGAAPATAVYFRLAAADVAPKYVLVPILYDPAAGSCATNITGQTLVTLGGLSQNIVTKVWTQTVRVQNITGAPIAGPVLLALDSLSGNAALTNSAGVTSCASPVGSPYVAIGNGLDTDQTAAITLTFTNSTAGQAITYTPRVLAGGNQQ